MKRNTQKRKKWNKIARTERFSLFQNVVEPSTFEVSWKKSGGRHYVPRLASASRGEGSALDRQMDLFRLHVTDPLDEAIAGESGRIILKNFERQEAKLNRLKVRRLWTRRNPNPQPPDR